MTADPEAATQTLRLTIPSRPEYLVLGRLVLAGIARVRPIDADALADLKLALTEACSNSMRHAYGGETAGSVEMAFEVGDGFVAIEVADDGPGFEHPPADAVQAAMNGTSLDEGGLGLEIIRTVMDETEMGARAGGSGSQIRFVKRLA